jgi:nucleoside-diphosphate-sugar epimerase
MKIAITGANGRLGSAVAVAAREAGHQVVGIDRRAAPDPTVLDLDLSDYDALATGLTGCDALIHLAAITGPGLHPDHIVYDNNVTASYNALRAAVDAGIGRICQASSVNAIGGRFSRVARYDFFPVDETHPAYVEDPYSLSKLACEQQADAIARRFDISIGSLRLHGLVGDRSDATRWHGLPPGALERQLWGYTRMDAAVDACLATVATDLHGHEVFYIVAPDTMVDTPSADLAGSHYPDVPLRHDLEGTTGFYDCSKANRLLGWVHRPSGPDESMEARTA